MTHDPQHHDRLALAAEAAGEGLYRPETEHDACGIGLVANVRGDKSHDVLTDALRILERLDHRGAVGSDPLTGDGAGILLQVPHALLAREASSLGLELPDAGTYGVGMMFLPIDPAARAERVRMVEETFTQGGLRVIGWRDVPVDPSQVGPLGREGLPHVAQVIVALAGGAADRDELERRMYVARKKAERRAREDAGASPFYFCSLSSRTIVYKGLLLPQRLPLFYPDLADAAFESAIAIVHQRFSTNTFPTWERAHPYRFVAHNGEINTLRGNVNWMRSREQLFESERFGSDVEALRPVIDENGSDSSMFDNALELLVHTGRSLPHAMRMMIPQAWQKHRTMSALRRAFYEYHASVMEPWDGPAAMAFTDGRFVGAMLDRNGLRPARYVVTKDDRVVLASEAGVLDFAPENVKARDRLRPGRVLLIDTEAGRIVGDDELEDALASRKPYAQWLARHLVRVNELPAPRLDRLPKALDPERRRALQRAHGYTREDVAMLITPMAVTGQEPIGAMGDDTPLAVLSDRPQLLFNYFKQLFAQVTNPPIDPIREELVMSLRTTLGPEHNLFAENAEQCHQLELDGPILTNERLQQIRELNAGELRAATIDAVFDASAGEVGLRSGLAAVQKAAAEAVRSGATLLIVSDRTQDRRRAAVPSLLAIASVHHHLIREGLRQKCGLIVESAEPREVMHFALLIGYGAGAVNPYLAFETIAEEVRDGTLELDVQTATEQYIKALHKGLLKVLSKMGISTLQSYRGAQIFEALGLGRELIEELFPGTPSRIAGIGLEVIAEESRMRHASAWAAAGEEAGLETGGRYKWRRDGERHMYDPNVIALLQHAVKSGKRSVFDEYAKHADEEATRNCAIRGLFETIPGEPVPLAEVEPIGSIVKRFKTGAMSFGSLSKEAHETLAIAMNRLGARSNSGEGGEDPARYVGGDDGESKRSAIKQVASGRFGVTIEYLTNADELQIKMAQGAKPGEGGQLPGHKVVGDIARVRHATEGVGLISPPPHHDIYSIEDLAQLIHDLRCANDRARISVKLVSEVGVGTVAAGVAKAGADVILISGHSGGTGASPLSSIKHAGVPWELGLSEAQQVLVTNDLRGRVRIEVDGQLKTGRDVIVAALLGAEEFGFGTAALVAAGCVMMRQCHMNTCPVGVATQDPELRARFKGQPAHVINLMLFLAEQVREQMAALGFRTMDEMIGRVDRLRVRDDVKTHWKARHVDLTTILHTPRAPATTARRFVAMPDRGGDSRLDAALLDAARPALERGERVEIELPIENVDRTACTRLSSEVTRRYGGAGLPAATVRVRFRGSAGQSFGAFLAPGLDVRLDGEANDAFGKGMSGGRLVVRPQGGSMFRAEENVIVGNVALYGATGGQAFVRGIAGERFAVRNSGATAVVEGVGDHGCEYMTRGLVVVLGPTGRNFAAGMSGGVAFVLDDDGDFAVRCNTEMVDLEEPDQDDLAAIHRLLVSHLELTESARAWRILSGWRRLRERFVKVMPREYKRALLSRGEARAARLKVL